MSSAVQDTREPLVWTFDFVLATFLEVDTDSAGSLLPPGLTPVEVAPGISLVNFAAVNFLPGGNGDLPEFQELTFNVPVSPDLRRGVPRFATYVVSLASTSRDHLKHSEDFYKLPVYGTLSHAVIDKGDLAVEYGDSRGTILSMENCGSDLSFRKSELYWQVFTLKDDIVYVADVNFRGMLNEHQERGKAGTLHNHAFYQGMNIDRIEPYAYLQMMSQPGETGEQIYYSPEEFV